MIAEGRFREDLYYRLNVFSIAIPPLREHREDIPLLMDHILRRYAQSMNKPVSGVSKEAMGLLMNYDWPGNVRELQNAIERAVLVCKTTEIKPEDLPFQASGAKERPAGQSLEIVEREHIKRVLEETGWNISQAARWLEIDRVTLYNKINKYGLRQGRAENAGKG